MFIIRPVQKSDLDRFVDFSSDNIVGITNITRDKVKLQKQISHSEASFQSDVTKPKDEEYRFVLEDLSTHTLGGTSAIFAKVSTNESFLYKIESLKTQAPFEAFPRDMRILRLKKADADISEIGALFLHPNFRHSGLGKLLSLNRFLFMAIFPQRFHMNIMAVMRAFISDSGSLPFWDGLGKHFCHLSYPQLIDFLDKHPAAIENILPQYPLYVDLLTNETQMAIGRTHENTLPAFNMLSREGFTFNNEIDIIDGGPALTAKKAQIRTVRTSAEVTAIVRPETIKTEEQFLISNTKIAFRACLASLRILDIDHGEISQDTAEALNIQTGDYIRFARTK